MTGAEFIRRIRKLARERNVEFHFNPLHGKGSHGRIYFGNRATTIKDRKKEIGVALLHRMLKQLGLTKRDIV